MVDRIRWNTVSYLPFYYVFFQFLLLTIFNLQANILTTKDILSNLGEVHGEQWMATHGASRVYSDTRSLPLYPVAWLKIKIFQDISVA